nr:hypothetical protein [Nitratireductor aquibiodomus]
MFRAQLWPGRAHHHILIGAQPGNILRSCRIADDNGRVFQGTARAVGIADDCGDLVPALQGFSDDAASHIS